MPLYTGDPSLDEALRRLFSSLTTPERGERGLLGSAPVIREAAFHDFSSYQTLLEPYRLRFTAPDDDDLLDDFERADVPLDVWTDFEDFVRRFRADAAEAVTTWVSERTTRWREVDDDYVRDVPVEEVVRSRRLQRMVLSFHDAFRLGMAPALYERYAATSAAAAFLAAAVAAVDAWLVSQLEAMRDADGAISMADVYQLESARFWQAGVGDVLGAIDGVGTFPGAEEEDGEGIGFGERLPPNYSFEPFWPESVNYGLQLIYRQTWVPLGTQPGEIVRTLPLGPKQVEKVTTKVVRRTKTTRQAEVTTSVETTTESSAATKDSSEVVQEASESFNWHVEASASGNFGFGSASLEAGMGGENASSSRDTKSTLNEAMEKTASKIRKDTKIVVSTEVEQSHELTQVSEISNPNDELAVTYIYSRLQRQYEVHTYLSDVSPVVFVAERVPSPREIDGHWIRRYDWILARHLLDESLLHDLEVVRNHEGGAPEALDPKVEALMETLSSAGLPDYASLPGTLPDIFQNPQQAYEREVERRRAREAEGESYRRSLRRLRAHLYDNILHYCRAIWSAEDPDARLMRFSRIRVPIAWEFVPTTSPEGHVVAGYYIPAVYDYARDSAPLAELVNPAGPIGFAGNYAVYLLRESERWESLLRALGHQQLPFLRTRVRVEAEHGGEGLSLDGVASERRLGAGRYRLLFEATAEPRFRVQREEADGALHDIGFVDARPGEPLAFDALRVSVGPLTALRDGDAFRVEVSVLPELEDPELKALRWTTPPLAPDDEVAFYSAAVLTRFAEYFEEVRRALASAPAPLDWSTLDERGRAVIRTYFHRYLLRERHTRRILVDTNNLLLTREVDGRSTLEPFKGLHRVADVLDAFGDVHTKRLENERRQRRLGADLLGDPEIEKVTVVAGEGLAGLAALDGPEEPTPVDDG